MTNYEKIKAMSVEEMADFFVDLFHSCITNKEGCSPWFNDGRTCWDCVTEYLLQEAEE